MTGISGPTVSESDDDEDGDDDEYTDSEEDTGIFFAMYANKAFYYHLITGRVMKQ